MLKELFEVASRLLGLAQDTQANKARIETLEQEMKTLSAAVRELAFEVRRMRDDQTHEHDKWALQLENAMLRFERRLLSEPQDHLGAGSGQAPAKD